MFVLFTVANQPNLIAGYVFFAQTYKTGLDTVVASLAGGTLPPTPALLNTAVYNYIQPIYFPASALPPTDQVQKINAMLGNQFNAYLDPKHPAWAFYSTRQLAIINDIIKQLAKVPINRLAIDNNSNFSAVIAENLVTSCLSIQEQTPLLTAITLIGTTTHYF